MHSSGMMRKQPFANTVVSSVSLSTSGHTALQGAVSNGRMPWHVEAIGTVAAGALSSVMIAYKVYGTVLVLSTRLVNKHGCNRLWQPHPLQLHVSLSRYCSCRLQLRPQPLFKPHAEHHWQDNLAAAAEGSSVEFTWCSLCTTMPASTMAAGHTQGDWAKCIACAAVVSASRTPWDATEVQVLPQASIACLAVAKWLVVDE